MIHHKYYCLAPCQSQAEKSSWPLIYPCKLHLAKWHLMSPVLIFVSVLQFMLALKKKKNRKRKSTLRSLGLIC